MPTLSGQLIAENPYNVASNLADLDRPHILGVSESDPVLHLIVVHINALAIR